ncbi:MAG: hypothetical protein ACTHMG_07530 [Sphingomonas sp.]
MVQMSAVWDRTTAFANGAMASILPIALLLFFAPIAVQLAIAPWVEGQLPAVRLIVMILFWAIALLGTLAVAVLALNATTRASEAVRAAAARLLPAIGVFILLGIIAGVLALPMGIAFDLSGVDVAALDGGEPNLSGMSTGVALFLLIYAIAYVVVVIWATARLLVVEPVILAERRGAGAITRSFAMTRGLALRIVGVLLLYAIVSTVAVLAARTVFGAIFALVLPNGDGISAAGIATAIIVAAVSAVFRVLAAIFVAKLYLAIVEATERHTDLP